MASSMTRLDYCQFLLSSQINYTLTYFAEHSRRFSHDLANRYLAGERITPRLLWENVRGQVVPSEAGYVVFDDTVLDKSHSKHIDLVRRQYSGNAKSVIRGIGVVNCVYVGSAEKHLVSSQISDIISLNINILAPEGSQSARFCGAPPAKACSFAWRFC